MVSVLVHEQPCCCHEACPYYGVSWSALTKRLFAFSVWLYWIIVCVLICWPGILTFSNWLGGDFKSYNITEMAARFYGSWCCISSSLCSLRVRCIPCSSVLKVELVPPSLLWSSNVLSSGLYFSACLGSLFLSILCTCCSHFFWYCFISFTMFCAPVFFPNTLILFFIQFCYSY